MYQFSVLWDHFIFFFKFGPIWVRNHCGLFELLVEKQEYRPSLHGGHSGFDPKLGQIWKKNKMIPEHWKLVHSSPKWYILWIWKKNLKKYFRTFFFQKNFKFFFQTKIWKKNFPIFFSFFFFRFIKYTI